MQAQQTSGSSALFRIAGIGVSLAFGAMVATLFAVKPLRDGLGFELNISAFIAFIVAATFAWFYWRMVERMAAEKAPQRRRKKFIVFSVGLVLVGLVSFLYPLKFIAEEKRKDVFIGLALAAGCITGIGIVMMKVKKFLDADLKKSEQEQRDE